MNHPTPEMPVVPVTPRRPRVVLVLLCGLLLAAAAACSSSGNKSAASSSTTDPAKASACGTWQTQYVGQPKATKTAEQAGYFVWTDVGGWHLRVRDASGGTFSGTVTSSKDIPSAKANPDGSATVSVKANQVTFEIKGTKDLTGFDLSPGCTPPPDLQLRFELQTNGSPADPSTIFTGTNSKAVSSTFIAVRAKS